MRTAGTASRIKSPAESLFGYLEIVLVRWKHRYFLVDIFFLVIDYIHTIALAAREGTLRRGKEGAGGGEYYLKTRAESAALAGGASCKEVVHRDMVFVSL